MTDNYGAAPEGHDGEHDMATDHPTETWHNDQPPVDDFADPASEGAAMVSEETETPADVAPADDETGEKKSVLFPIVAVVGGILVLAAVLYWQFGGVGQSAAPSPSVAQQAPSPQMTPPPSAPTSDAAATGNDISNLKQQAMQASDQGTQPTNDVAPTSALPAATGDVNPPAPSPVPAPSSTGIATPATASVQSTVPPSVSAPVPSVAPSPVSVAAASAPIVALTPAPVSAASDDRLNALSQHIDALQKAVDQATQQLNQVSNMVAANPPSAAANTATDDRLAKVEQQLAQLQHTAPATAAVPNDTMPVMNSAATETPTVTKTVSHHISHKKVVKVLHASSAAPSSHHHHSIAVTSAMPVSSHWVLRAATLDEAWVAKDSSSRELRPVHVGDELPGVGRVSAIQQQGDSWVIKGSQGTIH